MNESKCPICGSTINGHFHVIDNEIVNPKDVVETNGVYFVREEKPVFSGFGSPMITTCRKIRYPQ